MENCAPFDLLEGFTDECPICCESYGFSADHANIPMLLPGCQRDICKACIPRLTQRRILGGPYVQCPFCRSEIAPGDIEPFRLKQQVLAARAKAKKALRVGSIKPAAAVGALPPAAAIIQQPQLQAGAVAGPQAVAVRREGLRRPALIAALGTVCKGVLNLCVLVTFVVLVYTAVDESRKYVNSIEEQTAQYEALCVWDRMGWQRRFNVGFGRQYDPHGHLLHDPMCDTLRRGVNSEKMDYVELRRRIFARFAASMRTLLWETPATVRRRLGYY